MMEWYLVTYKQFEKRKLIDKQELIQVEKIMDGVNRIKSMNAQKRLTTTDYRHINLSQLLADNALEINAKLTN